MLQDFEPKEGTITYFKEMNLVFSVKCKYKCVFLSFLVISGVVNCSLGFVLASSDGGVADKFVGKNIYYDPNTFWDYVFGLQWIIATITSSIVAGAVAERCRLIAYFIYTVFITGT